MTERWSWKRKPFLAFAATPVPMAVSAIGPRWSGALELGAETISGLRRYAGAGDRPGRRKPFPAFAATPVAAAVSARESAAR